MSFIGFRLPKPEQELVAAKMKAPVVNYRSLQRDHSKLTGYHFARYRKLAMIGFSTNGSFFGGERDGNALVNRIKMGKKAGQISVPLQLISNATGWRKEE